MLNKIIGESEQTKLFAYHIVGQFKESDPIHSYFNVNWCPSVVLLSTKNFLTGEEYNYPKIIDTLRGGPNSDKELKDEWLPFLKNEWIPTNLFENRGYCWRFNNSKQEHKYKTKK